MMKKTVFIGFGIVSIAAMGLYFYNIKSVKNLEIQKILNSKNIYGYQVQEKVGQPEFLIINFWASWCPPCIQEIPSLAKFVELNPQFKVVAVSQDESLAEIKNILKTFPDLKNNNFEIVFDDTKSLSRAFKVEKLPESFIYQIKTNKMMQVSGSIDWTSDEVQKQISQYFKN